MDMQAPRYCNPTAESLSRGTSSSAGLPSLTAQPLQRQYSNVSPESEEFYQSMYERSQALNKELTRRIEQLQRENKQLLKSVGQYQHQLNACLRTIESLGGRWSLLPSNGGGAAANGVSNTTKLERKSSATSARTGRSSPLVSEMRLDARGSASTGGSSASTPRPRRFRRLCDLKGHSGAVYSVKYSPCGRRLASGALDRSVRVWDIAGDSDFKKAPLTIRHHDGNVSSLAWSPDSNQLLSGSYDGSARVWCFSRGRTQATYTLPGLVQSVVWGGQLGGAGSGGTYSRSLIFVASSKSPIMAFDPRVSASEEKPVLTFATNVRTAMVNSICLVANGQGGVALLSGDHAGQIRTWSLRNAKIIKEWGCGEGRRPVSHVASGGAQSPLLCANSYDNVLRLYTLSRGFAEPELLRSLEGHKNSNWPIRSALYASQTQTLVATGSSDDRAYVYDVSKGAKTVAPETLVGHRGRVCAVDFHPNRPLLASSSSDSTVKLWAAASIASSTAPSPAQERP